jgi:ABC-type amino acid transport substrate-binding protein
MGSQELANKYFVPEFKKQGVSWGNYVAFQPSDVLSKKPIRKIEDLQGMKIGAQGFSPEVAKALGVALVNLPYPELYTALQQGIIDANAQVGTDMNVVDSQNSVLDEISLRLKTTLSDVQDLDYTEAITKMNKDQLALESAQSSFAKISKLTLFSYIN